MHNRRRRQQRALKRKLEKQRGTIVEVVVKDTEQLKRKEENELSEKGVELDVFVGEEPEVGVELEVHVGDEPLAEVKKTPKKLGKK